MRRYSDDDEERSRMQRMVREWARSGLLEAGQAETLAAHLQVDLRRTNPFLRAGLALFTVLIVAAFVGLVAELLQIHDKVAIAALTGIAAMASIALAELLAGAYRCYRFGIEEALAVSSVVLLGISVAQLWLGKPDISPLLVGAAGGYGLYRRFGFIYAAIGGAVCLAAIPFAYDLPVAVQRSIAVAIAGAMFAAARSRRLTFGDDYPGDEYGLLQAAALAGVYVALNIQLSQGRYVVGGWFYWFTYIVIWILPIAGLRFGIRDRDRNLIDVSLVLVLVTLITNKPYLGWTKNAWDPIVFGTLLIGVAIAARRWLERGPNHERRGFTARRILDKDRTARSVLSMASATLPPQTAAHAEAAPPQFGGGRSGGAGGGGTY